MKLKGKVAIVTGAGYGMGREMALAFAAEGADLVLAARTQSNLDTLASEIRGMGCKAIPVSTDVQIEEQVNRMVDQTAAEFGKIDVIVNNAGGYFGTIGTMLSDLTLDKWLTVMNTNLTGSFLCTRAVLRYMLKQKNGNIIYISSSVGQRGRAGSSAYTAAKHGIEGLTKVMALELAPFNIRVNALHPGGPVGTPSVLKAHGNVSGLLPPEVIRDAAVYLASDDSIGVTGQSVNAQLWNANREDVRKLLDKRGKG